MTKFLTWCGKRVIESWAVIQWALVGVIIGLIVAATVLTFVHYAAVILTRWVI